MKNWQKAQLQKLPNRKLCKSYLKGDTGFFAASFPFRHFLRQHVLRIVCLARRLLLSKAHNTQQTFQLSNLEFRRFPLEEIICCTMEIYNEDSDISSSPNTTYKNLHHLHPQNHLERQPCWKNIEIEADSYINMTSLWLSLIMRLVRLMWKSAFDPKSVFRRSSLPARLEERLSCSK